MAGYLVNTDRLVKVLLTRFMPDDVTALPERDVDAIDRLPMVIFTVGNGAATANGAVRRAQIRPVTFTILAGPTADRSAREHALDLGDTLTEVVLEKFPTRDGRVADVGAVARVTGEMSLPALSGVSVIDAREIAQVTAAFEFVVQPLA